MKKKRIAAYVDGFNLYHGLDNLKQPHLKWLNLKSLCEKFIDRKHETINRIYYFSAVATFLNKESIRRHRAYIEALETIGVKFISGNFKNKRLKYRTKHIRIEWDKHEEKETDVNISINILNDAIRRKYDKFIIITNDTDIVPAIKMARNLNKEASFKLITPPCLNTHDALLDAIKPGKCTKLTVSHLETSLLPKTITKPNGKIIRIPNRYKPNTA